MAMLFSFWLIQPVLSATTETEIHECCRRAGLHHCQMGRSTTDGPALNSAPCPMYQWHGTAVTATTFDIVGVSHVDLVLATTQIDFPDRQAAVLTSDRDAHSRGPPSL